MNDVEDGGRLVVARCGFALFVAGILVPLVVVWFLPLTLALALGVTAELFALLFGLLGRRHLPGKVAATGSMALALLLIASAAIAGSWRFAGSWRCLGIKLQYSQVSIGVAARLLHHAQTGISRAVLWQMLMDVVVLSFVFKQVSGDQ